MSLRVMNQKVMNVMMNIQVIVLFSSSFVHCKYVVFFAKLKCVVVTSEDTTIDNDNDDGVDIKMANKVLNKWDLLCNRNK